ncbi:DUF2267 domain-containing protein [Ciceribacter sp. L1K23]|uniref:DUF2267 domain-containing protein n=1 Tax=Ciceribacter sp. L1K23 TaxID=2820276 RepID=UPI001B845ECE|nr:DUF2267 domain-containing protein [Ciceribacter sp. L1K23]MBR0555683.1 DUF2267 domain-containing protein [Ciceribacter sp. L1K23]
MTVPMEYRHASRDFDAFMTDLRDHAMLQTTHQTYTMLQAVLYAFRRRLDIKQAIAFAAVLPPVLRAIFVSDWDVDVPPVPFGSEAEMMAEVRALRHNHNLSTDWAIRDVAVVLWRHVDPAAFERVLSDLPEGAREFWRIGET